ncbi:MAG: class I SAM-dependent methyltransferase [Acidobacteriota bacterium]|jgi:SAM-dependent methyltransferase
MLSDRQIGYWDRVGPGKTFSHPVNLERLDELLPADARIVEIGCGYGRVLEILWRHGCRELDGFDFAPAMVAAARARVPQARIARIAGPELPLHDGCADAVLLITVLTCVPGDDDQRAIVAEAERVLRPRGVLYISDLWLQDDERNRARYGRGAPGFDTYGVFELPEGVVLRHHRRGWIDELTRGFSPIALDEITVETMNGHRARGFQWFGRRNARIDELPGAEVRA